jgi:TatD DNase family protein
MPDIENIWDSHTHLLISTKNTVHQLIDPHIKPYPHYFSAGIHPEHASKTSDYQLQELFNSVNGLSNFVAVGEIGLDTRYPEMDLQEEVYIFQLKMASKFNKPVILHCVNAWQPCMHLHKKHAPNTALIYHGFNKTSQTQDILKYLPCYISIGEALHKNTSLQQQVKDISLERILIESDTSTIPILDTYQLLAEIKQLPLQTIIEQLTINNSKLFLNERMA